MRWNSLLRPSLWSALRRDTRGAAIVLVAIAAVPLVAFVGIGTDVARGYLVKSRLSSALDAAALAGGRDYFLATRDADIGMYFNANFPPGYLGATVTGPNIAEDTDAETLTVAATARIPTTFMRVLGFEHMDLAAESQITRAMKALDVVLAIDISASMSQPAAGGGSRLSAARQAAGDLIDILYGNNGTKDLLKIGLVPWNAKVRITLDGVTFRPWQTVSEAVPAFTNPLTGAVQSLVYRVNNSPVPLFTAPLSTWRGCVFNRYLDDGLANDGDIFNGPGTYGGTDWMAWAPVGPEGEPVPSWPICTLSVNGGECTQCPNHGITPLSNQKQVIVDAVNDLTNPNSNTNIPQGLGWAWRVLMPDAPFTEGSAETPDVELQRAIVLLTDGENFGGNGDGYKAVFGTGTSAQPEMDDRLRLLAANIKASGVIVYAIQFAHEGTELQELMQDVASGPGSPYYHFAPDAESLRQVFREVANHLSELRLSR